MFKSCNSMLIIGLCSIFLCSCATLFTSRQQNVTFDSNEEAVDIYINGEKICKTPCVAKVDRSRDTMLIIGKKNGFEDATVTVNSGINIVTLINLISFTTGSFGLTTDITNSHAWEYQPNAFYLTMEKEDTTPGAQEKRAKERKIREYVLSNYSDIKADVVYTGRKEYLISLSTMTGISLERLSALAAQSRDEADLTNAVIREYKKFK